QASRMRPAVSSGRYRAAQAGHRRACRMLLPVEQADAIAAMVQEGKMLTLHRSLVWMWSQDATLGGILALLLAFTFILLPLMDYQGGIDLVAGLLASVLLVSASF